MLKDASFIKMMKDYFSKPDTVRPYKEVPSVRKSFAFPEAVNPVITWFGHSSYHIVFNNYSILVDPVFSSYASPVSVFGKGFKGTSQYTAADFPHIDLLIITHDHYDHLDQPTIIALKSRTGRIIAPLGVGEHLQYWGIDADKITELDWWQSTSPDAGITVTATPARHFSGRGLVRNKTLWASFVLSLHGHNIFIGGDSGYDAQFRIIGNTYGPFELAILECGQYGDDWPHIHMTPEQTVQAALDLHTALLLPVHWGKFALAMHAWNEPVTRVTAAAKKTGLPVVTPRIGEGFMIGEEPVMQDWWNF